MPLNSQIHAGDDIHTIASHLDGLPKQERLKQVLALGRRDQTQLYERAIDAPPLDLEYFVPKHIGPQKEIVHYGRNSQPAFKLFQKRWCRTEIGSDTLIGYNETFVRPFIGPGYFVAHPSDGGGTDIRGAVVVDYFMLPEGPIPDGWPPIKANHQGLQKFVYQKTRDYMRRVSEHVTVGIAYRQEKRVMGYFVLCREDAV